MACRERRSPFGEEHASAVFLSGQLIGERCCYFPQGLMPSGVNWQPFPFPRSRESDVLSALIMMTTGVIAFGA